MSTDIKHRYTGAVSIIGQKKYSEKHIVEIGEVQLHPPVNPQTGDIESSWIMLMAQIVGMAHVGRTVLATFNMELIAFLAADNETIGQKFDMVTIRPQADGSVVITKGVPSALPAQIDG